MTTRLETALRIALDEQVRNRRRGGASALFGSSVGASVSGDAVLALIQRNECREAVAKATCVIYEGGSYACTESRAFKHPECAIAALTEYLAGEEK